jgi:hypothetical protein
MGAVNDFDGASRNCESAFTGMRVAVPGWTSINL